MARPTKYIEDFHPESYISLSAEGLTKAMICSEWDICRDTMYDWGDAHDKFSDAIKKGDQKRMAKTEKKMFDIIHSGKGNVVGLIFMMKNMFPKEYRDKQDIEHSGENPITINYVKKES